MRPDIAYSLIHFTRGEGQNSAYESLRKIVKERRLLGSDRMIRGGYPCICFSEAPYDLLTCGLTNSDGYGRYSGYGLIFSKQYIFDLGGRPVIYQPDCEYDMLPDSHRWRHVRFDLSDPKVDFTWEREWRVQSSAMSFTKNDLSIVLPDDDAQKRFVADIERDSFHEAWSWSVVLGDIAWGYDCGNVWRTVTLKKKCRTGNG